MNVPSKLLSLFWYPESGRSGSRTKKIINILACHLIQKNFCVATYLTLEMSTLLICLPIIPTLKLGLTNLIRHQGMKCKLTE